MLLISSITRMKCWELLQTTCMCHRLRTVLALLGNVSYHFHVTCVRHLGKGEVAAQPQFEYIYVADFSSLRLGWYHSVNER